MTMQLFVRVPAQLALNAAVGPHASSAAAASKTFTPLPVFTTLINCMLTLRLTRCGASDWHPSYYAAPNLVSVHKRRTLT